MDITNHMASTLMMWFFAFYTGYDQFIKKCVNVHVTKFGNKELTRRQKECHNLSILLRHVKHNKIYLLRMKNYTRCHDLQLLCTGCSTLVGREAMS